MPNIIASKKTVIIVVVVLLLVLGLALGLGLGLGLKKHHKKVQFTRAGLEPLLRSVSKSCHRLLRLS